MIAAAQIGFYSLLLTGYFEQASRRNFLCSAAIVLLSNVALSYFIDLSMGLSVVVMLLVIVNGVGGSLALVTALGVTLRNFS